jgi:hypothetical protein
MKSLDKAVDLVLQWTSDRKKERDEVLSSLDSVIADCREAIKVWQGYLDSPGEPGDQWTLVSWLGPQRVKTLHEINLKAKERLERVCHMAGPAVGRFIIFDEDIVEMAYRQLNAGETGTDAAKSAIETMGRRIDYIRDLSEHIRAAKPPTKKAPARPKAKAGGKKSAKKKKPSKKKTKTGKPKKGSKK